MYHLYHEGSSVFRDISLNFCLMPIHHSYLTEKCQDNKFNVCLTACFISQLILLLHDGVLGYLLTICNILIDFFVEHFGICSEFWLPQCVLSQSARDSYRVVESYFPNFIFSHTSRRCQNRLSMKKKKKSNMRIGLSNALRSPEWRNLVKLL